MGVKGGEEVVQKVHHFNWKTGLGHGGETNYVREEDGDVLVHSCDPRGDVSSPQGVQTGSGLPLQELPGHHLWKDGANKALVQLLFLLVQKVCFHVQDVPLGDLGVDLPHLNVHPPLCPVHVVANHAAQDGEHHEEHEDPVGGHLGHLVAKVPRVVAVHQLRLHRPDV